MEDTHEENSTMHASAPIADEHMHEADVSQHGLVDMLDFDVLVNCTTALENNFASLNENVTKMSNLLKELICSQALGIPVVSPKNDVGHETTSSRGPSPSFKAAESLVS